jgi:hypothetical protein
LVITKLIRGNNREVALFACFFAMAVVKTHLTAGGLIQRKGGD